jgi:hypothetical protein
MLRTEGVASTQKEANKKWNSPGFGELEKRNMVDYEEEGYMGKSQPTYTFGSPPKTGQFHLNISTLSRVGVTVILPVILPLIFPSVILFLSSVAGRIGL